MLINDNQLIWVSRSNEIMHVLRFQLEFLEKRQNQSSAKTQSQMYQSRLRNSKFWLQKIDFIFILYMNGMGILLFQVKLIYHQLQLMESQLRMENF
ncbi:unnamed protein product [Paramecium sonneborni]|uniref:Uncharacterized protein n=1 Tax=Paramecium sonneborni TaxID=65129 RepID=A0A8S1Q4H2_9CILI|nr:unnamed protein product [Paramecium sonneborni]